MSVQPTILDWDSLNETARSLTTARRVRRPGQAPSTAPISSGLYKLAPDEVSPVLLYRDSNSWCPFCERAWFCLEEKELPFEAEFIDLSNKPQWYLDLVPTALVPAAKVENTLIYESTAILLALEERFAPSLLPQDSNEKAIALQLMQAAEASGSLLDDYSLLRKAPIEPNALAQVKATVEAKLDELEKDLGTYSGPYFMSTFSLVDIMYSPLLDRLAANLPVYWGYAIKGNPRFPRLNAWFEALKQRPAYGRVKSDDLTNNLLMRRRYGLEPIANPAPLDTADSEAIAYRAEAAERLSDNREAAIADILKNSGVQALSRDGDITVIKDSVDFHLKLLANHLLHKDSGAPLPWGRIGGRENLDPTIAAVGAIALAYIRNRICAPRDMSAGAATAFRAAADQVLASIY